MPNKSLLRKIGDRSIGLLGYLPVHKADFSEESRTKAVSLFLTGRVIQQWEEIQKRGLQKPTKVTFKMLKEVARKDALIRICVNLIKKSVSQCPWEICVKDNAPDGPEGYEKEKELAYSLFEYLNPNRETLRVLLDRVLEDLLVLDAGCIEKVWTLDETEIRELNAVDGAIIRPVYDQWGTLGDPAYKQVIQNKVMAEFKMNEMVYMMANPQNDIELFGYGMSPIESILLQVQAALEADMHNIKAFSSDNVPPGILDLGQVDDDEAEAFMALWNATVLNNKQAVKFMWGGSKENDRKWIPLKSSNRDMEYTEYIKWLSGVKLSIYGLSNIDANIMLGVNRATAEVQQQLSESRGVRSTKNLVEEYFTRQIVWELGGEIMNPANRFRQLQFKFKEAVSLTDKKIQAEIDKIYVDSGIWQADEVREDQGKEPLPKTIKDDMNELDLAIREQELKDRQSESDNGEDEE